MSRLVNKLTYLEKKNPRARDTAQTRDFFHMRKIRVVTNQSTQMEIRYFFPKPLLEPDGKAVRVTVVKAC
jgi:hypothetical protein